MCNPIQHTVGKVWITFLRCSTKQPGRHGWASHFVFWFSSVSIAKMLEKKAEEPRKGYIWRTGPAADSVHEVIKNKACKIVHPICNESLQNPQLEQVELIEAPSFVAETLSDDPGEELPTGWQALSEYKLFITCTLERYIVANQRKNGSAVGFSGVVRVLMEDW